MPYEKVGPAFAKGYRLLMLELFQEHCLSVAGICRNENDSRSEWAQIATLLTERSEPGCVPRLHPGRVQTRWAIYKVWFVMPLYEQALSKNV